MSPDLLIAKAALKPASNNAQLPLPFWLPRAESRGLLSRLPFGLAPHLVRRRVRRVLSQESLIELSARRCDLFLLRQYAEDVTVLEQIEQRARRLARATRRREIGCARSAWTAFSCTPAGRRIHAVRDALIQRIESEEAALCG